MTPLPVTHVVATRPRHLKTATSAVCLVLTAACDLGPFDMDPRFQSLGRQMDDAALLVASERAADVFDPSAPMTSGATLGRRRLAASVRVVASGGHRPDLSTASAADDGQTPHRLGSTPAGGQTIVADAALRVLPGFPVGERRYRVLGLDGLVRVARRATSVEGDAPNRVVASWGGRLGLLSDSAGQSGISASIQSATAAGAIYTVGVRPAAPATSLQLGMEVSEVHTTAFRLQGSARRGEWGLTAGMGSTNGVFRVLRHARLTYADSTSAANDEGLDAWEQATANAGVTRVVGRVELSLQYGFASRPSRGGGTALSHVSAVPRHSVALGAQVRY